MHAAPRPGSVSHRQVSANSFAFCSYKKSLSKPFRICSSKTKNLKSFRFCSYEKTYTYPPASNFAGEGLYPDSPALTLLRRNEMIIRFANRECADQGATASACLEPNGSVNAKRSTGISSLQTKVHRQEAKEWRSGTSPRNPRRRPRARFKRGMVLAMKRFGTAWAVALVALCVTAGCNDYGNTFQVNTGASLTSLSPANIPAGGSTDLILTVIGGGFVAKTVVQWDGQKLDTTVTTDVNGNVTNVTAKVPAALTAKPGRHFVNTLNPSTSKQDNGLSNTLAFIVTVPANPQPTLSGISPNMAAPGSADVTLTVTGTNFVKPSVTGCANTDGSLVQWNTTNSTTCLVTTFTSATQLTATVPANLLTTESCATVTVFTGPAIDTTNSGIGGGGGGTSNAETFTVSTNASFCPAAAVAANVAVAAAEETPAVSLDGRFVAFTGAPGGSGASGQRSAHTQIFLRDTCEGASSDCTPKTTLLSSAMDGTEGNADSHSPSITSDGRYVAFSSAATNLASETPSGKQIFLRDTCRGAASGCTPKTELISTDPNGLLSATDNLLPSISSSGRFVAFLSVKSANAKSTGTSQNNGVRQVFVRDTCIGAPSGCTPKTTRISTQPGDATSVGGKPAGPAISSNGSAVGITDNHSASLFTRSVAVDDRVFLAITKEQ